MLVGLGITSDACGKHPREIQNELTILLRIVECVIGERSPYSLPFLEREMIPVVAAVLEGEDSKEVGCEKQGRS